MKMKLTFSGMLIASALSLPVAANDKAPGSGPNPFSDCGIGAALFKNDVAAVISNVIWDLGTTAVTSATASPETCEGKEADAAAFIMESYNNLVEDNAHGEGEYFAALMDILDVGSKDRGMVMDVVRSSMSNNIADETFVSLTKAQRAEVYYHSVMSAVSELS